MAEAWGQILRAIGALLNGIYEVIPNYGVAIILLTVIVRLILFPLGVKQIRSMSAMQKIQPKLKEIQKKHKGDRQRLNEEMMKLYREHGVNPLGGCFPLLLQMPVFIALYAVIRSAVPYEAIVTEPVMLEISTKGVICRPVDTESVRCEAEGGKEQTFSIATVRQIEGKRLIGQELTALPSSVTRCTQFLTDKTNKKLVTGLRCESPLGTGHLPRDGELTSDIVAEKATFLGMHLACSPTQSLSKSSIRQCTSAEGAGGGAAVVLYFLLVVLMAGTTFWQQKQMSSRAPPGPQAQQMQMMGRIMPLFMGFLSLNFPTALSLYWVVGNFWMIGQQHVILNKMMPQEPGGGAGEPAKGGKKPATPNGPKQGGPKQGGKRGGKPKR